MIVVGIGNNINRAQDYVPTNTCTAGGGGNAAYLQFIRTELIPFIEANVGGDPARRALLGHSHGGSFIYYALFAEAPGSHPFSAYLASDSSIGCMPATADAWDAAYAASFAELPVRLHMSHTSINNFDIAFAQRIRDRGYARSGGHRTDLCRHAHRHHPGGVRRCDRVRVRALSADAPRAMPATAADLQLDWLRAFVAVVDAGSLTAAAPQVHRSQSALSMQLKKLEDAVGRAVLTRGPRHLELTPTGVELLGYARRMLELHTEARAALKGAALTGRVNLGVPDDYAAAYLTPVLRSFATRHAGVEITLVCEQSTLLIPKLSRGELDLAVVTRDKPQSRHAAVRRAAGVGGRVATRGLAARPAADRGVRARQPGAPRRAARTGRDEAALPHRLQQLEPGGPHRRGRRRPRGGRAHPLQHAGAPDAAEREARPAAAAHDGGGAAAQQGEQGLERGRCDARAGAPHATACGVILTLRRAA